MNARKGGDAAMSRQTKASSGSNARHDDRGVYVISVAAELAGVHPQTLRIYERKGLLTPARTAGNTRRYSQRDIERLQMIQRLTQEYGINLAGVKMIVELQNELERLRRKMDQMSRELQSNREQARHADRPEGRPGEMVRVRDVMRLPWARAGGPFASDKR